MKVAELDDLLLHHRYKFKRYLNAHVASGNHDSIRVLNYLLDVVDTFLVLDLRYEEYVVSAQVP